MGGKVRFEFKKFKIISFFCNVSLKRGLEYSVTIAIVINFRQNNPIC